MVQRIAIYQGEGAIPLSLLGALILNAQDLIFGDWEASLLIMPGGRDRPYHAALQGAGNQRIRAFVEEGGTYLGLCAGAYYGCKRVEFDRGFPLEVCEERELKFFSGTAIGPAYGGGTYDYNSRKGARAARIATANGVFHSYFNGGCLFEGDFFSSKILARYLDLPGQPPAIIECPLGKGKAILSGVHLETGMNDLDLTDPYHSAIHPLLKDSEPQRQKFWEELIRLSN